ncbi:hypothetical protein [Streptomyces sp. NPDC059247]|uniref:hypothetical protein n=1 Tax=Streptomyces sp. NPDC059247 TaxID=3346790 RepID=UPI0036940BA2
MPLPPLPSRTAPAPRAARTAGTAHTPRRPGPAVLCLALLALATGCASTPPAAPPAAPPGRPAPPPAAASPVTYGLPVDTVSLVLPATGAESRGAQGLDAFGQLAAAWAVENCVRKRGGTPPDGPPPMFTRYALLPDLEHLRAHGFGSDTRVPGAPPPADPAAAPGPAPRACLAEGRNAGRGLADVYGALRNRWFEEIAPVDRSPGVRRALLGLRDCLTAHRVDARDEESFFALVDRRLQNGDTAAGRALGRTYADCMAPVEAVREPLRAKAAERFRAAHSAEIAAVRAELPARIGELETRYGIRFSFPAL